MNDKRFALAQDAACLLQRRQEKQALFSQHVNQRNFPSRDTEKSRSEQTQVKKFATGSARLLLFFWNDGLRGCSQLEESAEYPSIEALNETWSDSQVHTLLLLSFLRGGGEEGERILPRQHVPLASPAAAVFLNYAGGQKVDDATGKLCRSKNNPALVFADLEMF